MGNTNEFQDVSQGIKRQSQPRHYLIYRDLSVHISRMLVRTSLTANQISLLGILFGVAGGLFLTAQGSKLSTWLNLLGVLLLFLNLLADKVDGEVARWRKTISVEGMFYDELNHAVVPAVIFLALAWRIFNENGDFTAAFVAAIPAVTTLVLRIIESSPYKIYGLHLGKLGYTANLNAVPLPLGWQRVDRWLLRPFNLFWRYHYLLWWLLLWVISGQDIRILTTVTVCAHAVVLCKLLILYPRYELRARIAAIKK